MPFSPAVKEQAIVAAAGHCCVCHRFEAGHIEVHHIQPQAAGGADDFANAIALCFDCHTWAGHYNSTHPKGARYSPTMLRKARDSWYAQVEGGSIVNALDKPLVHVRYLISRDHDASVSLLSGDTHNSPIKESMLLENDIGLHIRKTLKLRPNGVRRYWGDSYHTAEAFLSAHPEAKCNKQDLGGFHYYECLRHSNVDEFRITAKADGISQIALSNGVGINDLCVVAVENGECGDGSMTEVFLTRPAWTVFLSVTNISEMPLAFEGLIGGEDADSSYRPFAFPETINHMPMPSCEISSGQSVLIPLALLLAPIGEIDEQYVEVMNISEPGDSVEVLNLTEFNPSDLKEFRLVGPAFWPQELKICKGEASVTQALHSLNIDSVYTIDRVWMCGSCPHLFARSIDGIWQYLGELIPDGYKRETRQTVNLPSDVTELIIAELEDETSHLEEVAIDGHIVAGRVELQKGDQLRIPVNLARVLLVVGSYSSDVTQINTNFGTEMRNRLICRFLKDLEGVMLEGAHDENPHQHRCARPPSSFSLLSGRAWPDAEPHAR